VIDGESRTLATLYLSQFNEELMKLSEADAHFFHNYVAKLLFLCKRARPDIQTAKIPKTDDYKKLTRTMRYLRETD